jgi:radical SAM superfamily enzyme YgiQ (UPF0313 family)
MTVSEGAAPGSRPDEAGRTGPAHAMPEPLDLLIVNPGNRTQIYQGLGSDLSAIEPPVWAGLMATFARARGFSVSMIDAEAEDLVPEQVAASVARLGARLVTVVVYGHQPSASTQNMTAAGATVRAIKRARPDQPVLLIGGHVSALPERTLREEAADYVCEGEGPYTLEALLSALRSGSGPPDLTRVPGLWWRDGDAVRHTDRAPLVADLDAELPAVAWDLLPMERYRAHNWHCFGTIHARKPYASIYTTLGCPYRCSFCCINAPFGRPVYRMRSPESVATEVDGLVRKHGVRNIKIVDEMFVLNMTHVLGICERLIAGGHDLNIWAYARVDTVKPHILETLRKAGITWLALGIESGSKHVRDGAEKSFGRHDITEVVRTIQAAGINVIGNFIFGLPDDDLDTMRQTLDLALDLNCEMANFYSAMAYPGSPLYSMALAERWPLPESWQGFSQHAEDTLPLPTRFVGAHDVLRFRDAAFTTYFTSPRYLEMVERKFGSETAVHVRAMAAKKLVRRYA